MVMRKSATLKKRESKQRTLFIELMRMIDSNTLPSEDFWVLIRKIRAASKEVRKARQKPKDTVVSEHAVMVFMETMMQVDMEEIEKKILTPQALKYIKTFGDGVFPSGEKFKVNVVNNVVIDIITGE